MQVNQHSTDAMRSDPFLHLSILMAVLAPGKNSCAWHTEAQRRSMLLAGPFQSLIFADSICSLASAAPLVYITKPWHFASWKIVVTLLSFQVRATPRPFLDCCRPGSVVACTMRAGRAATPWACLIYWRWQHQYCMLCWTYAQTGPGAPQGWTSDSDCLLVCSLTSHATAGACLWCSTCIDVLHSLLCDITALRALLTAHCRLSLQEQEQDSELHDMASVIGASLVVSSIPMACCRLSAQQQAHISCSTWSRTICSLPLQPPCWWCSS